LRSFWIKTGGRLHLGQLDLNGSSGRMFGGLGIAINEPTMELAAEKYDSLVAVSGSADCKRLEQIANAYLQHYRLPGVKIGLNESLPAHCGLGSGTCLSLAVGLAITRIYGLNSSVVELASITDREGSRSGLGVGAFEHGGFLVDGGKVVAGENRRRIPPLVTRLSFPEEWRIVLAYTNAERVFGNKEESAFRSLPPMKEEVSGAICRVLMMKLLPSLVEKDLASFGTAVTSIQEHLGGYFSAIQGGLYASAEGADIAEFMRTHGAVGVGQSSWGPTIYGFVRQENAPYVVQELQHYIGNRGRAWATSGRNRGASCGWVDATQLSVAEGCSKRDS
jgi:beta-ribofuranosylaminobenzene 5'-phosphate synthase